MSRIIGSVDSQTAALDRTKDNIKRAAQDGGTARVSDDTMRHLFGTPDPALTPEQQFRRDFVGEKPDAAANRARRAFCTAHGLKARQDRANGYWSFSA